MRLFPQNHTDIPDSSKLPFQVKDVIVQYVECELSFIDRIRCLISGRISVVTKTSTEGVIGRNRTASGISVRPPEFLDFKLTPFKDQAL